MVSGTFIHASGNQTGEKLKEMKKTASRILSTRGTKTDQWMCGVCYQWDDHWPPTCPYTDDPTRPRPHSKTAKLIQSKMQAQGMLLNFV